ncbi:hypothetical protein GGF50DRAFT_102074 [Schizophyllum commune]
MLGPTYPAYGLGGQPFNMSPSPEVQRHASAHRSQSHPAPASYPPWPCGQSGPYAGPGVASAASSHSSSTHLPPNDRDALHFRESCTRLPPAHDYYMGGDLFPPPPPASYRPTPSSPETGGFHPLASTAGAGHPHGHQYSMSQVDAPSSLSWPQPSWSLPYENTSTTTAGTSVAQNRLAAAVLYTDPLSPAMHFNSSPPPTSPIPSAFSSPYAGQDSLSEWSDGAHSFAMDYDGQSVGSAYQSYARPIAKSEVATPAMRGAADRRRKKPHRFFCTFCEAGFTAKHNLQAHERSHIGKKGFACNKCGLAFDNPGVLKRHSDRCTGYAAR